ncbi:putative dna mismatch repair protein pms1 protein [Neofusicoccum parvum UCRNP2]|uniref:Putative dna mismatch repair protein pms1 protein n=1 Tax=Botryosphaeria parva (strain UCR-NP2) TaxID=1287680 RepID=R1E862_BOTPV|nr:putative dna mismatch repair protein pms1 protein [Neofusicoccum parvum UCRNP2]
MATIKAIEGRSVGSTRRIPSYTHLLTLGTPDVRFKNYGLDSIEVQDNGHGIAPDDYETIALKHYTSKLSTYNDLSSLQTFGFRGEALSSLCALSHFHILTARASDGPKGTRLDFEPSGKLKGTSVVASQKGTTVAVENLFYNLPVRRRELDKNIKREYGKVLGLLHAYACISVGVRFAVSSQTAQGKKTTVFSTKPNPTTRENIANVYGAKTLLALIPLDLTLEMTPTTSYNVTQSPFIFANLVMDTGAYDVNVSPDKRTILLHDQTALLEALKGALIQLFEEHDQTVPQAQLATITIGDKTTTMTIGTPEAKRRRIHTPNLRLFTAPGMDMTGTENDEIEDDEAESEVESQDERNAAEGVEEPDSSAPDQTKEGSSDVEMAESGDDASDRDAEEALASAEEKDSDEAVPEEDEAGAGDGENAEQLPREDSPLFVQQDEDSDEEYLDEDEKKAREETRVAEIIAKAEETATRPTQDNLKRATNILKGNAKRASTLQLVQYLETSVLKIERTLTQLGERLQAYPREAEEDGEFSSSKTDQTPEERLSLTVSKSDFGRMRIIGQFNLGFILAVRPASSTLSTTQRPTQAPTPPAAISHADELFIIDQHASDEKINFERLTNTTILAPQRLVHPHTLDLTAIEEEIILSHPSAFAANGFQLTTDTSGDAPVGKRCSLLGLPVSKETTFTVSDLEELVALLSESSFSPEKESSIPRPGKMEKVVREMGDIDKPWNYEIKNFLASPSLFPHPYPGLSTFPFLYLPSHPSMSAPHV